MSQARQDLFEQLLWSEAMEETPDSNLKILGITEGEDVEAFNEAVASADGLLIAFDAEQTLTDALLDVVLPETGGASRVAYLSKHLSGKGYGVFSAASKGAANKEVWACDKGRVEMYKAFEKKLEAKLQSRSAPGALTVARRPSGTRESVSPCAMSFKRKTPHRRLERTTPAVRRRAEDWRGRRQQSNAAPKTGEDDASSPTPRRRLERTTPVVRRRAEDGRRLAEVAGSDAGPVRHPEGRRARRGGRPRADVDADALGAALQRHQPAARADGPFRRVVPERLVEFLWRRSRRGARSEMWSRRRRGRDKRRTGLGETPRPRRRGVAASAPLKIFKVAAASPRVLD